MYKIVVADDEQLERQVIKAILENGEEFDVKIVGEACDGENAIKLTEKLNPDIIFMDIKMPDIDGLESTKIIKDKFPHVKIIMLTAFDEFSYAQEALKLGALDYLLKPARPHQIINVLKKAIKEIEMEKKRRQKESELKERLKMVMPYIEISFVLDLVFGNIDDLQEIKERLTFLGMNSIPCVVMLVNIDNFSKATYYQSEINKQFLKKDVLSSIRSVIDEYNSLMAVPLGGDNIIILYSSTKDKGKGEIKNSVVELGEKIRKEIEKNTPVTVTVGIGGYYNDPRELYNSYQEAINSQRHSFFIGGNQVIHIDDVRDFEKTGITYPYKKEKELVEKVKMGDGKGASRILKEFLELWFEGEEKGHPFMIKTRMLELLVMLTRGAVEGGADFKELSEFNYKNTRELIDIKSRDELKSWVEIILTKLVEMVNNNRDSFKQKTINKSLNYIRENYRDITLGKVSSFVHLSPYYLSRLFKNEVGCTFIEYVTNLRLEQAKKMLKSTSDSIVDIARKIGYSEPGYFSKVFKKKFGISPNEYRKNE
ncbi:MAG: response regulator [Firmicutes bacterium]|nr:response regulator [Bacillota bacterium]